MRDLVPNPLGPPLSKNEKLTLTAHFKQEEIPKSSFLMLSPDNGEMPYMASNKSSSGKFLMRSMLKSLN